MCVDIRMSIITNYDYYCLVDSRHAANTCTTADNTDSLNACKCIVLHTAVFSCCC